MSAGRAVFFSVLRSTFRKAPVLTRLDDPGPLLTPAQAVALHYRPEAMAWFAVPAPGGAGVIARAHTEAHDGGRLLPGYLAAADLAGLQAMMPPGLTFDPVLVVGSPPGCLAWWWHWPQARGQSRGKSAG